MPVQQDAPQPVLDVIPAPPSGQDIQTADMPAPRSNGGIDIVIFLLVLIVAVGAFVPANAYHKRRKPIASDRKPATALLEPSSLLPPRSRCSSRP